MQVYGVIDLADADRRLARDFEPRRPRAEAVPRFAAGKELAEIDILVELETDQVVASPHHRCGNFLRRQLDMKLVADLLVMVDDRHQPPGREVADLDQLLFARSVGELGDAQHRRHALVRAALGRTRNRGRQGYRGGFERSIGRTVAQVSGASPDQREHAHKPPGARYSRQNGTLWTLGLKERFVLPVWYVARVGSHRGRNE